MFPRGVSFPPLRLNLILFNLGTRRSYAARVLRGLCQERNKFPPFLSLPPSPAPRRRGRTAGIDRAALSASAILFPKGVLSAGYRTSARQPPSYRITRDTRSRVSRRIIGDFAYPFHRLRLTRRVSRSSSSRTVAVYACKLTRRFCLSE